MMNNEDIMNEVFKSRDFNKEIDSSILPVTALFFISARYNALQKANIIDVDMRDTSLYSMAATTGVAIYNMLKEYTDEDKNRIVKKLTDEFLYALRCGGERG